MKQSFLSRYSSDTAGHPRPSTPHLFDSELVGFAAWDGDGILVAANREFCRVTGIERRALEHGSVPIAELLAGFDFGTTAVQEHTISRGGETRLLRLQADLEMRHAFLVDATGQHAAEVALANARRLLEIHAAAITGTDPSELLSAQPSHDVQTKLERQQREIEELLERVTAAHHELEAFSYSVSHDLRAPLRAVDGFSAELLERYAPLLDARGQHYVTRIRTGAQRLGQTIDDLLRLSRVSRAPLSTVPVDLAAIARTIADEVTSGSTRRVRWIVPEHLPVDGDRELLSLALQNLLHNAWKFTAPRDEAVIELRAEGPQSRRVYSIRDNGVGFDMRYADKLFAPFQRLHAAATFEGTGIGLATVKRIIHRHAGQVWAESTAGGGATFSFTLPRPRQDHA
ncbi:MAG TPA: ATP-binding protein [Thermoanaerobaculia bacterium]|nr:ATP-binding protein [Thermoanaerobaculia bacterium]